MKLNQIFVIGNLVKDSEVKTLSNGRKKQVFTIAVNDDYKKAGTDEWIKRAYFFDCYVVGKEYADLKKGKKVVINGKMTTYNYEVEGNKKKFTQIEVFTLDFMVQKENGNDEVVKAKTVEENKKFEDVDNLPF